MNSVKVNVQSRRRIGIIDAGVAGLRCVSILTKRPDFDVTILEGRSRIGGRVAQDTFLGCKIDIGANWIHDVEITADGLSNPITAIAFDTQIAIHKWNDKTRVLNHNGESIPEDVAAEAMNTLQAILDQAAKYSQEQMQSKAIASQQSLADYLRQAIPPYYAARQDLDSNMSGLTLALSEMWVCRATGRIPVDPQAHM